MVGGVDGEDVTVTVNGDREQNPRDGGLRRPPCPGFVLDMILLWPRGASPGSVPFRGRATALTGYGAVDREKISAGLGIGELDRLEDLGCPIDVAVGMGADKEDASVREERAGVLGTRNGHRPDRDDLIRDRVHDPSGSDLS